MIATLRLSTYKNGYLLIIAAWLFTLSFIISNYWNYTSSPQRVKARFEKYIVEAEQTYNRFAEDTTFIKSVLDKDERTPGSLKYDAGEVALFLYTNASDESLQLKYWNSYKVIPGATDLQKPDGKYYTEYSNGEFEFIKRTLNVNGGQVMAIALVPLRWAYFIENNYLKPEFAGLEDAGKKYELAKGEDKPDFVVRNGDGKLLFGVKEKSKYKDPGDSAVPLTCKILAVIFVLIFFNALASSVAHHKGWMQGFMVLFALLLVSRALSYWLPFPFHYQQLELFDPGVYASNTLHPSLGDLLINIVLLFWLISFIKQPALQYIRQNISFAGLQAKIVTVISCVAFVVLSFVFAGVIRSLINDSKIPFNVVNFFGLNIYTLISFVILCFITLIFYHLGHLFLLILYKCGPMPAFTKYLLIAVVGLFYLSIAAPSPALVSNLYVLVWLLIFVLILDIRKEDIFEPLIKSSFFLVWLLFFASSISVLIISQNSKLEAEQIKGVAEKLALQTDPSAESVMNIALSNFNNRFLGENFYRFKTDISNKIIKDSLISENFSGYLNKYDTRIYTFDKNRMPLFNEDSATYEIINNIIVNQSKPTSLPDFYYYENSFDYFSYIYEKEVLDPDGERLGYFYVVAKPKKYKSEALYPELFKQVKDVSTDLNVNYAYAIYNNGELINHYGDYNFITRIAKSKIPRQEYTYIRNGESDELWYNAGNNKLVIVVNNSSLFFEAVTLVAYLFGAFLFIILIIQLGRFLLLTRFRLRKMRQAFHLNIRSQVQSTIIFISVFSFLIIGIATISFYINRYNKNNRERLLKAIQVMATQIQAQVASNAIFDDVVKIYDMGASSNLERTINQVSELHSVDINFYDLDGVLQVSTQPYIYNKQILSKMMEPGAYFRLHYNHEIHVVQDEYVGDFSYMSIYVPVLDDEGKEYAYLNIPYLNSQRELNQEISNFLVTLINLNAFIFVLAGAIALWVTYRITNSFTIISNKMREVNLGKTNEEIVWDSKDEIGILVDEYNKMVRKLEDSAIALAKSEREGAWREMARQVAHEIKNPLTPMKLSLQYLQGVIDDNKPGVQALTQRVAATLVEQIDQLAKIASDFSQFANIGHVEVEKFDIRDTIASLVNLYSSNEMYSIKYEALQTPAIISGDRSQMTRLFTNLFQNGIEAVADKEKAEIRIAMQREGNKLLIGVADNGLGIPLEKQDQIFNPNFTTKTSGTGLGLAICRGIVEKANGKIWFETKEGEGTVFYILLPLVNQPG